MNQYETFLEIFCDTYKMVKATVKNYIYKFNSLSKNNKTEKQIQNICNLSYHQCYWQEHHLLYLIKFMWITQITLSVEKHLIKYLINKNGECCE